MDSKTLRKIASDCQSIARYFANRQNSDTTLTSRECTALVNTLLDAGNTLEAVAREQDSPQPPQLQEISSV